MAPLYSLLLTGGKSTRMGQDKSQLCYRGSTPEWQRLHALLSSLTEQCFLCHRADQDFGVPAIIDSGDGPLAAIHTAQLAHPAARWLVVACDLPLLERETLETLIQQADEQSICTAYRNRVDGLPDPLCAIYEPRSATIIQESIAQGIHCPRKVLTSHGCHLLNLAFPHALDNANSPADSLEIRSHLDGCRHEKPLSLLYFAQLRDLAGKDSEQLISTAVTASGLYDELKANYQFPHKQKHLMLAINGEFSDWATPLKAGDEVVFIPPVAGG